MGSPSLAALIEDHRQQSSRSTGSSHRLPWSAHHRYRPSGAMGSSSRAVLGEGNGQRSPSAVSSPLRVAPLVEEHWQRLVWVASGASAPALCSMGPARQRRAAAQRDF
mmetsp:Transcript_77553/g.225084  ORF Transcript_77553/g.225084 Transcript_77553/m.225084 type:complete len:108 (+) Transcript_77553:683-1006(+)